MRPSSRGHLLEQMSLLDRWRPTSDRAVLMRSAYENYANDPAPYLFQGGVRGAASTTAAVGVPVLLAHKVLRAARKGVLGDAVKSYRNLHVLSPEVASKTFGDLLSARGAVVPRNLYFAETIPEAARVAARSVPTPVETAAAYLRVNPGNVEGARALYARTVSGTRDIFKHKMGDALDVVPKLDRMLNILRRKIPAALPGLAVGGAALGVWGARKKMDRRSAALEELQRQLGQVDERTLMDRGRLSPLDVLAVPSKLVNLALGGA